MVRSWQFEKRITRHGKLRRRARGRLLDVSKGKDMSCRRGYSLITLLQKFERFLFFIISSDKDKFFQNLKTYLPLICLQLRPGYKRFITSKRFTITLEPD